MPFMKWFCPILECICSTFSIRSRREPSLIRTIPSEPFRKPFAKRTSTRPPSVGISSSKSAEPIRIDSTWHELRSKFPHLKTNLISFFMQKLLPSVNAHLFQGTSIRTIAQFAQVSRDNLFAFILYCQFYTVIYSPSTTTRAAKCSSTTTTAARAIWNVMERPSLGFTTYLGSHARSIFIMDPTT